LDYIIQNKVQISLREKLRQVDLNLLITFAAIAEEKSITACSLFEGCSLAAESSIRRYRFGSCQCKQQTTRDECGEAWLDTEPSEMVRSRLGTVA